METRNITPEAVDLCAKEKSQSNETGSNKFFDEKNYLNVRLDTSHGELTKEIRIRILPIDADSNSPFKRVHMHYVKVNKKISNSGFKNYICAKETHDKAVPSNSECPFCDIKKGAWEKYNELKKEEETVRKSTELNAEEKRNELERITVEKDKWRKVANENTANEYAIVRCIERGHENDGPKFWKFAIRSDEKDPMHSIVKLFNTRKNESIEEQYGLDFLSKSKDEQLAQFERDGFQPVNILDIYDGKDLKLTINAVRNKQGEITDKVTIDIADYGSNKPISRDESEIEKWVNNPKVWSDVFAIKPYEYLDVVSKGGVPYFDKNENKWVAWKDDNQQTTKVTEKDMEVTHSIMETASAAKQMDSVNKETDSDLPF